MSRTLAELIVFIGDGERVGGRWPRFPSGMREKACTFRTNVYSSYRLFYFPLCCSGGIVGARPITRLQLGAKKDGKLLGILRTLSSGPILLVSILSSSLNLNPLPPRVQSAALLSGFRNATQVQLCHTFSDRYALSSKCVLKNDYFVSFISLFYYLINDAAGII